MKPTIFRFHMPSRMLMDRQALRHVHAVVVMTLRYTIAVVTLFPDDCLHGLQTRSVRREDLSSGIANGSH